MSMIPLSPVAGPLVATAIMSHNFLDIPSAINIISGSVRTIYGVIESLSKTKNTSGYLQDLNNYIAEIDLMAKLDIYTTMISEIGESKSKTVRQCIYNIRDVIKSIEHEMLIIKKYKQYNESLYLAKGWRSYTFQGNIKNLKTLAIKLDSRIKMLDISYKIISSSTKCGNPLERSIEQMRLSQIKIDENYSNVDIDFLGKN